MIDALHVAHTAIKPTVTMQAFNETFEEWMEGLQADLGCGGGAEGALTIAQDSGDPAPLYAGHERAGDGSILHLSTEDIQAAIAVARGEETAAGAADSEAPPPGTCQPMGNGTAIARNDAASTNPGIAAAVGSDDSPAAGREAAPPSAVNAAGPSAEDPQAARLRVLREKLGCSPSKDNVLMEFLTAAAADGMPGQSGPPEKPDEVHPPASERSKTGAAAGIQSTSGLSEPTAMVPSPSDARRHPRATGSTVFAGSSGTQAKVCTQTLTTQTGRVHTNMQTEKVLTVVARWIVETQA